MKPWRNFANAYLLVLGLVMILLAVIAVKLTQVYWHDEAVSMMQKRVDQIEEIYTGYLRAGEEVTALNKAAIDRLLIEQAEGIDAFAETRALNRDSDQLIEAVQPDRGESLLKLASEAIDLVETEALDSFLMNKYGIAISQAVQAPVYFDADVGQHRWRVLLKPHESGGIIVAGIKTDDYRQAEAELSRRIETRIKDHLEVSSEQIELALVKSGKSHPIFKAVDLKSGRPVREVLERSAPGDFSFQVKTDEGYRSYDAYVRKSETYDAYIVLYTEEMSVFEQLSYRTGGFFGLMAAVLGLIFAGTLWRFYWGLRTRNSGKSI